MQGEQPSMVGGEAGEATGTALYGLCGAVSFVLSEFSAMGFAS